MSLSLLALTVNLLSLGRHSYLNIVKLGWMFLHKSVLIDMLWLMSLSSSLSKHVIMLLLLFLSLSHHSISSYQASLFWLHSSKIPWHRFLLMGLKFSLLILVLVQKGSSVLWPGCCWSLWSLWALSLTDWFSLSSLLNINWFIGWASLRVHDNISWRLSSCASDRDVWIRVSVLAFFNLLLLFVDLHQLVVLSSELIVLLYPLLSWIRSKAWAKAIVFVASRFLGSWLSSLSHHLDVSVQVLSCLSDLPHSSLQWALYWHLLLWRWPPRSRLHVWIFSPPWWVDPWVEVLFCLSTLIDDRLRVWSAHHLGFGLDWSTLPHWQWLRHLCCHTSYLSRYAWAPLDGVLLGNCALFEWVFEFTSRSCGLLRLALLVYSWICWSLSFCHSSLLFLLFCFFLSPFLLLLLFLSQFKHQFFILNNNVFNVFWIQIIHPIRCMIFLKVLNSHNYSCFKDSWPLRLTEQFQKVCNLPRCKESWF